MKWSFPSPAAMNGGFPSPPDHWMQNKFNAPFETAQAIRELFKKRLIHRNDLRPDFLKPNVPHTVQLPAWRQWWAKCDCNIKMVNYTSNSKFFLMRALKIQKNCKCRFLRSKKPEKTQLLSKKRSFRNQFSITGGHCGRMPSTPDHCLQHKF